MYKSHCAGHVIQHIDPIGERLKWLYPFYHPLLTHVGSIQPVSLEEITLHRVHAHIRPCKVPKSRTGGTSQKLENALQTSIGPANCAPMAVSIWRVSNLLRSCRIFSVSKVLEAVTFRRTWRVPKQDWHEKLKQKLDLEDVIHVQIRVRVRGPCRP